MRLTKHVFYYPNEFIIPLWGLMTGNTCVIRGDDGRLAITDPGTATGPHLGLVKLQMLVDGLHFSDINSIVVLHAHPDHAAAAPELASQLNARLYAHKLERRALENPDQIWHDEEKLFRGFSQYVLSAKPAFIHSVCMACFGKTPAVKQWTPLEDGDVLDFGTRVEVIQFGGHRPGEIALYVREDRALICGDTLNRERAGIPSLNFPCSDLTIALRALKYISTLDVDVIVCGHSKPLHGPGAHSIIIRTIERAQKMQKKCDRIIGRRPGISLWELGWRLIQPDPGIYKIELKATAWAVLKSTEKGRAWLRRHGARID